MSNHRKFKFDQRIADWRPLIRSVRAKLGVSETHYPDALVMAIMHIESKPPGNPSSHRPGSQFHGFLQQGRDQAKELGRPNSKYADGDPEAALWGFFTWMELPSKKKNHQYNPEFMSIIWKGGGGTLRSYKRALEKGGPEAGLKFLSTRFGGSSLSYLTYFRRAFPLWLKHTNEPVPEPEEPEPVATPTKSQTDTHYGKETSVREMNPFELGSYITPEEMRKGIIAQIYYPNDWHVIQLAQKEKRQTWNEKESGLDGKESDNATTAEATARNVDVTTAKKDAKISRGDSLVDERRRYAQALVEAEFYRRRLASRSVPAIAGPFNPYPVAGFPGLIMTPGRPILGYVTAVSHSINVGSATGSTSVSMVSPRYWDEGEIWYWYGGEKSSNFIMRNFPQWHNSLTVAQNNTLRDNDFLRLPILSELDKFYDFYLGCDSIEYSSNHRGKVTPEIIKKAIKDRDPGPLEVKPETLEIKEYNTAIATLDSKGRFAPGTLANRFYGPIEPYDVSEASVAVEKQLEYVERYGVTERQLLVDFLGNSYGFSSSNGRLLLTGPTFGGDRVNAVQNQVLDYIDDLEKRRLVGGV